MFDYRMKALAKALNNETPETSINIKETGETGDGGFVDQETEADHEDYLDLLDNFFEKLEAGTPPVEECKETIERLLQMFIEETEEVQEVCTTLGGLEALSASWQRQTGSIVEALNQAYVLYRTGDFEGLSSCQERVEKALRERLPLYSTYQMAHARYVSEVLEPLLEQEEPESTNL